MGVHPCSFSTCSATVGTNCKDHGTNRNTKTAERTEAEPGAKAERSRGRRNNARRRGTAPAAGAAPKTNNRIGDLPADVR